MGLSDHRRPGWWPDPHAEAGRVARMWEFGGDRRRGVETLSPSMVMFTGPTQVDSPVALKLHPFQWLCSRWFQHT